MPRELQPPTPRIRPSARKALVGGGGIACLALGLALFAPGIAWALGNLLLLGPFAAAAIVLLREVVRILVARAFGFTLFGIRWGAGPCLARLRGWGVHHRFGPIPIGADTRLASSRPRHHRIARGAWILAPGLCQLAVAGVWLASEASGSTVQAMTRGPAAEAVLQLVNLGLLGLHLLIPFETRSGLRSDLLRGIDLWLSGPEEDRAARASAHVLTVERLLESGRLDDARSRLDAALVQLGREVALIRMQERLARILAAPEPEPAARLDACSDPFERSADEGAERRGGGLGWRARVARSGLSIVPLALATTLLLPALTDSTRARLHGGLLEDAQIVVQAADPASCRAHLPHFESRIRRLSSWLRTPRPLQVRELARRAALHACAGDLERALLDQSLAVEIANGLRRALLERGGGNARDRIQAEIDFTSQLRQLAIWHAQRGDYREALRETRRARVELERAIEDETARHGGPEWARQRVDLALSQLADTQEWILRSMRGPHEPRVGSISTPFPSGLRFARNPYHRHSREFVS